MESRCRMNVFVTKIVATVYFLGGFFSDEEKTFLTIQELPMFFYLEEENLVWERWRIYINYPGLLCHQEK